MKNCKTIYKNVTKSEKAYDVNMAITTYKNISKTVSAIINNNIKKKTDKQIQLKICGDQLCVERVDEFNSFSSVGSNQGLLSLSRESSFIKTESIGLFGIGSSHGIAYYGNELGLKI